MAKRKRLTPSISLPAGNADPLNTRSVKDTQRSYRAAPIASVTGDASAAAALDEMADTLRQAREGGRMVLSLPLDSIQADYLMRDRMSADPEGMQALKQSLRHRGQQAPIEVEFLNADRYGLISGWRRLQALRELQQEEGAGGEFDTVLALLRTPEQSADAYLAMVEENEIRVGLSYYERARIAAKAAEAGVFETEKSALQGLYHAVSRAKRSKIKSFIRIVEAFDDDLKFPEAIGERLGLALAKAIEADEGVKERLQQSLLSAQIIDAESEQACLLGAIQETVQPKPKVKTTKMDSNSKGSANLMSRVELRPGLHMRTNSDGSVTLQGSALDADLRTRISEWLMKK